MSRIVIANSKLGIAGALAAWILVGAVGKVDASSRLATFDEVQNQLSKPGSRLLDARSRAEYDKAHAPGAVWVDLNAAEGLAARPDGLTDKAAWESWLAPLGIEPETEVLVFDGTRQLGAARIWWLLSYLGVEKVGLIDGNFELWKSQGRPVTSEIPKVPPRAFPVQIRADRHASRSDVMDALKAGQTTIVDARSQAEYAGERKLAKRAGHIPGACRLEWSELVDAEGRFLEESALRGKVEAMKIKPGEPVITHCQGGGRSSVDAFAFERLGFPTRNFYLGWSDWGNATETPITEGRDPGGRP
ncbi:sulfurtransferase [Tundrisphaera lichenicola]|uniref:sulfurtransferase n=1 Tax=Tundrisphaera lichenicola TaxID=2029860 RepID=UPI003EB83E6D